MSSIVKLGKEGDFCNSMVNACNCLVSGMLKKYLACVKYCLKSRCCSSTGVGYKGAPSPCEF